jgi:digalactosyldiacylglycerol synthase
MDASPQYVYPHGKTFASPEDQAAYIRDWLSQRAGLRKEAEALRLRFYPAKYHPEFGSIFSIDDVPTVIPDQEADALILEEPEHLNWSVSWWPIGPLTP